MEKKATDLYIEKFSFWEHLSDEEREFLNDHTYPVKFAKGEMVRSGNDRCAGVMLVKKGRLRTYTMSSDGRDVTLYRIEEGDVGVMSASCALQSVTFHVLIEAEDDTEVLLTESDAFRRLADENVYVRCFGYEKASERLSEMLWKLQQVLFLSADQRLAIFLRDESGRLGTDELRITHEQIAKYMGSAREVVSRLLKYFSQEGIVEVRRGAIRIKDKNRLHQMAED
ncbi:MAG: Crp/Fnr family transcriptional regulator [Schwartzia succinivorans]|uniref:Crp/Fnr family transcriptional regulator n=1 Tax=Schwartzia succinivorans TaxID=55507 RepID=UPI00235265E1|nr:Crp/Fnr family transcriptional regulator [Schwartzia succinivorans]MBE6097892.1 Crp/Fnr family transcriptional regulator [Schwartzia succinivorans]